MNRYLTRLNIQRARMLDDSLCGRCSLSTKVWYAMFTRWHG